MERMAKRRDQVRVPAVYLTLAEVTILAFLDFFEINKLRGIRGRFGFESRPAHREIAGCIGLPQHTAQTSFSLAFDNYYGRPLEHVHLQGRNKGRYI
jgi:hypothetical protein